METPRACPRIWKTKSGKYLFWFHNHNGRDFFGRNPAWVSGGIEKDGFIHWSQPEILLYSPVQKGVKQTDWNAIRISYPDLIEQDGRYWITETQKSIARVHEVDGTLFEGLWSQGTVRTVVEDGLLLTAAGQRLLQIPPLRNLQQLGGFSMDIWLELSRAQPGRILLDARNGKGKGVALVLDEDNAVRLEMSDGRKWSGLVSDAGLLLQNRLHHVAVIVDSGPRIVTFIVDGRLCDGGEQREYGWSRFHAELADVNGKESVRLSRDVKQLRIYGRALRTSEAIANFHAGPPAQ